MKRTFAARAIATLAAGCLWAAAAPAHAQDAKTIKIASLAPEGSSWMKLFHEWGSDIEKKSGGKLKVKFFAGGVAGDERDVVRKMKLGQLQGAAVTAVGLGLIQPEVRLLELPFLIKTYGELDHVRQTLDGEIRKKFEDKGYVLLGWGDVGPVHIFSQTPLRSKADLMATKVWAWMDDPIVKALFEQVHLPGVPMGVPDVLPALQTGMINACYGSPLSTLALQWQSKVKYVTSMIISQSVGASVMTKQAWDGLGPDLQKIVADESKVLEAKLLKTVRDDNETALAKMKAQGIQVIETPPEVVHEFETQAKTVGTTLEGKVYSHDFHVRVEKLVADLRAGKK